MSFFGTTDFLLRVRRGLVPKHTMINKFGENPLVPNSEVFQTVWDGTGIYVAPTTARIHNVASDEAADDGDILSSGTATDGSVIVIIDDGATFVSDGVTVGDYILNDTKLTIGVATTVTEDRIDVANNMRNPNSGITATGNESGDDYRIVTNASTGASILHIKGLSSSFLNQEEFIVLNGVADVATVNTWTRQYRCRVFGPGTTGALGTITVTAETDNTITSQVINGNNQTQMAVFTVPANMIGYIVSWNAKISKKQTAVSAVQLRAGTLGGITYIIDNDIVSSAANSRFQQVMDYVPIADGTDVFVTANSDTAATSIAGGFTMVLVEQ